MKTENFEIKREDGSVFAVVNTYIDEEDKRFIKLRVVEDSDWLYVDDMQALAIQLNTLVLKLQYRDDKLDK
jgi:hypothetical protein